MPIPQGVRGLLVPLDCAEEGPRERRRETREGERVLLPGTYLSSDFGAHAVERPPTPADTARTESRVPHSVCTMGMES